MRLLLLSLLTLLFGFSARAQEVRPEPLIVPFAEAPPFMHLNRDGVRAGFFVDLARMIGAEIGLPIVFRDAVSVAELARWQVQGRTHMVAGTVALPPLAATNVFSDAVGTEELLLTTWTDRKALYQNRLPQGHRIGVVFPLKGAAEQILHANVPVDFDDTQTAFVELLLGKVDALLSPPSMVYWLARQAGLDGLIGRAGDVIDTSSRHVALHESRADLLGPINKAIARIEADGRLEELRQRYAITVPPAAPEVLTIGITHAPPYGIIDAQGDISGFSFDTWRDLAQLAGLQIDFEIIDGARYSAGPSTTTSFDAAGLLTVSEDRLTRMDFTLPLQQFEYQLFFRTDNPPADAADPFSKRRIAVLPQALNNAMQQSLAGYDIVDAASLEAMVQGLLQGSYDAIFTLPDAALKLFEEYGASDQVDVYPRSFFRSELAPALRPGLGSVRERLDAVIPAYLLSDEYAALHAKYFGAPVFWSEARITTAIGAGAAAITALVIYLVWQRQRQNRQDLLREKAYSRELSDLVTKLENANREQAEFTYAISHDLKSPANTIEMLINELAEVADLGPDGGTVLQDMARTNRNMRVLVDDVLSYSRIVEEDITRKNVDLIDLITEICGDLRCAIDEAQASLDIGTLPTILGNRTQLRMLFQNILSNAMKFRSSGRAPKIEVSAQQLADCVEVTVKDNGIGIPEQYRDKVFGLFQRLNAQSSYEGSGIGLTICQRVMTNHKGTIRVGKGIESGTALTMVFPVEVT